MKVLVTGATGFVGKRLVAKLIERNHEVVVLSRCKIKAQKALALPCHFYSWNPETELPPTEAITHVQAVINLMGENIAVRRWSTKQKEKILNSRTIATHNLIQALEKNLTHPLDVFISSSAVGIYPVNETLTITEQTPSAQGFLADVCKAWEKSAQQITQTQRKVIIRTGVVMGHEAGALAKLLPLFRLGLGGPIGAGKQYMSWIHVDDLVSIYIEALENKTYQGVYNGVAPYPVTNKEWSKTLGDALHVPALFPVPPFMLKLIFGEMSTVILDGQKVVPENLLKQNFKFEYPYIKNAFANICPLEKTSGVSKEKPCHIFRCHQWVPTPLDQTFTFFSDPKNLEKITPPWLNFHITKEPSSLQTGSLIEYQLKIHGVNIKWQTLIEDFKLNSHFKDIQTKGPYSIWNHTHRFISCAGGTLIQDEVHFRLPFGILGSLFIPFICKDITKIFSYRKKVITEILKE
ncbi:MAG: TIGR01777 family oxidoreductase [Bacteriovoracaceae bacterium]|nr:TIGR01777 family oxidoreductase [Bacteriovoracaceae bacterium]